uniref:(northern house mosquito) hypothetical protein n=1 Tax=Culex pipiens TaxID=7175 RepID=A0A8D8C7P2_CULPI
MLPCLDPFFALELLQLHVLRTLEDVLVGAAAGLDLVRNRGKIVRILEQSHVHMTDLDGRQRKLAALLFQTFRLLLLKNPLLFKLLGELHNLAPQQAVLLLNRTILTLLHTHLRPQVSNLHQLPLAFLPLTSFPVTLRLAQLIPLTSNVLQLPCLLLRSGLGRTQHRLALGLTDVPGDFLVPVQLAPQLADVQPLLVAVLLLQVEAPALFLGRAERLLDASVDHPLHLDLHLVDLVAQLLGRVGPLQLVPVG